MSAMPTRILTAAAALLMSGLTGGLLAQARRVDLRPAWAAWKEGDIDVAQHLAEEALAARASDEAHHVLCLTAFVRGDYRGALDHYRAIDPRYRRLGELDDTVINIHLHLGAVQAARDFAGTRRGVSSVTRQRLDAHAQRPFTIDLTGVTVVPFADHPLSEYFPAFDAEINGQRVTVHLDTGGTYLLMGPARAAALGIATTKGERGEAHLNRIKVDVSYGLADLFVLGDAVLRHVPVEVVSTLTGDADWIILGTNLLEPFLSTMDYPSRRMLLSLRNAPAARAQHLAMLPVPTAVVPFYLWGDHFMFARGAVGDRARLNFFVDSGLVSLHPDDAGGIRQASFTSSGRKFAQWGVSRSAIKNGHFESTSPLCLGPLCQERPLFVVGDAGDNNFGGVRIDGLISHAFLKRYVWTIDFDARMYQFAESSLASLPALAAHTP